MPTLAERWLEEGKEKGIQLGMLMEKQQVLIMLLSSRFNLAEFEKQQILKVQDPRKLDEALKLVIKAQTKEEVLSSLQKVSKT